MKRRIHQLVALCSAVLVVGGIVSCSSSKRSAEPAAADLTDGWPKGNRFWREQEYGILQVSMPTIAEAEIIGDDELCMTCHSAYVKTFAHNVHRQQKCEDCHGPASRHVQTRGKEPGLILSFKTMPPAERSEVCLKCHEQQQCEPGSKWRTSVHAHKGVTCNDCHTSHYNVPPGTPATTEPGAAAAEFDAIRLTAASEESLASLRGTSNHLGAIMPNVCYKCHQETEQLETVAHPHQVGGPNAINCNTCHDPHGKILQTSRKQLCLECHKGSPTMAYHSSTHNIEGVACTDCHNPHPSTSVRQVVNVAHWSVNRPKRTPMSVDEPEACYKCHPKIFGMANLPSHHAIREGKLVCSDCHDGHGQAHGNLKEVSVNMLCWKCHAEKQGPFAHEHPPVTENCLICHEPHGTIANNLLRQPATFLCLRCHSGHRGFRRQIDTDPSQRPALYTDCSQCHQQVHGSDLPAATGTPRFTR